MTASESEPAATNSSMENPEAKTDGNGQQPESELKAEQPDAGLRTGQHHVSHLLDEVLDEPEPPPNARRLRHPMVLDLILGVGLLVAMGGFTIGLFKMYVVHSAQQSIFQHNYKAAIGMLKGVPAPGLFSIPGADPDELLNQALYLDAMDKLEVDNDTDGALKELQQVKAGSRYFSLSQQIIEENFTPSSTTLQAGATATPADAVPIEERKPILPDEPQGGSQ
jgi:hypothetical protein